MRDLSYLNNYYNTIDENGRLISKHGRIEYITTMKYINDYLKPGMRVLEVGAGTGRYSLALASQGYQIDALDLVEHNIEILKSQIQPEFKINAVVGDALDLSRYEDESFDLVLVLGPMYHLYNDEDKVKCLSEAIKKTKKEGRIMVSYCLNEATIITFGFINNNIKEVLKNNMLTKDYHCTSTPKEIFELVRIEDINRINSHFNVVRDKIVATDGATNYIRQVINDMDEETYNIYIDYHLAICERQDLIGASHHCLDILIKK
jgi:2-polyprenyl-3-methyl-5-hydroxy-6-metoxy-1,4-benzoquinol methylase